MQCNIADLVKEIEITSYNCYAMDTLACIKIDSIVLIYLICAAHEVSFRVEHDHNGIDYKFEKSPIVLYEPTLKDAVERCLYLQKTGHLALIGSLNDSKEGDL